MLLIAEVDVNSQDSEVCRGVRVVVRTEVILITKSTELIVVCE